MKKIILLILVCFSNMLSFSQTDGISYQAVIIDNNPQEIPGVDIPSNNLPNTPLQVQFSIIDNANTIEYQENHNTTTDAFGMINLMIGQGNATIGLFNQIYWNNDKFLKVEIDLNDGNGLVEFSYQELTYIPYVKHREIIATSTLDVDGATNLNNTLSVNNGSNTLLTGNLDVDGVTNIYSSFTVNNESPTLLTGDLTVDGIVSFDGELEVGGDTQLYADLTVEGNTVMNGNLNVVGSSNFSDGTFENLTVTQNTNVNTLNADGVTNINNAFNVLNANLSSLSGNLNVDGSSSFNNQVTINANLTGGQGSLNAHPLRVQGSNQGVAIQLTAGTPNNSNNFITFFNSGGNAVGRIEGETTGEVASSPEFIFNNSILVAQEILSIANVASSFTPVATVGTPVAQAGPCTPCIIRAAADLILATANLAAYNIFAFNNLGVSYQSGSADYAEWLERINPNEIILPGEIVGVTSGKISKHTLNARQYMVISTKPAVLGNMPDVEKEALYEKVAFMGQIPVKVRGTVFSGDYIIPSGLNDGTGIAISPNKIQPKQYRLIVGVSWSEVLIDKGISLINMAIGLNSNDVADLAVKQEEKIKSLEDRLNRLESRFPDNESDNSKVNSTTVAQEDVPKKTMSREEILITYMPTKLDDNLLNEALQYLKKSYESNSIDFEKHVGLKKLFIDANYRSEILRKTKANYIVYYQNLLNSMKQN